MLESAKVLVAGGTGTLGIPLVKLLRQRGAQVSVVSMDPPDYARRVLVGEDVHFQRLDLTDFDNCLQATKGQDYVFNLVGIKGSVGIAQTKVASYFYPMILFQTHLMEAAFRNEVSGYLFVSSVCGYPQSSSPKKEDDMWQGLPKQNDRIPGLAKRIGEVQGETYLLEHSWDGVRIVRPANVYGPFDDFDPATAQVIPALIARMVDGENPVRVWGDGSAVRDFIYSEECAYWLAEAMEKGPPSVPVNLGSGMPVTIREVAQTIVLQMPQPPTLEWDTSKPAGDPVRVLDVNRARQTLGFSQRVPLEEGVRRTIEWYLANRDLATQKGKRYYGR